MCQAVWSTTVSTSEPPRVPPAGSAFLLTQLGTHAASAFAERIARLDLTPPQTGLLRVVASEPGRSQQALAQQLGTPPTRLVALVDGLEERGLLERRRNPGDRRLHAVHLGPAGEKLMGEIRDVAREHDDAVLAPLDDDERARLRELLGKLADAHGLTPGVHPGYRHLGAPDAKGAPGDQAS
ncbi:DNA-binding MarR family transcriptional regulator [Pseudonocardia endophytica]|uniref:DNA-binding MarR family transcriptional regulator n=1 Tax=Pseudonocardia endophytica TaxID=401976 RepID=A0A4V2PH94_PSEEN|nr:DNA-binding MarR family transcriptional regulator [Pseudonocardia endophytica]